MFIDAQQQFSDKQAVTSTGYSTNSVEIPPGLTAGIDMAAQIIVRSESGTNPTLTVELETSADDSTYTKLVGIKKPDGDKVFKHKIVDWEAGVLFWHCRQSHGIEWEKPFRAKLEQDLTGKDLMFLMGNQHRFQDQWLIISLIYPPKRKPVEVTPQGSLF